MRSAKHEQHLGSSISSWRKVFDRHCVDAWAGCRSLMLLVHMRGAASLIPVQGEKGDPEQLKEANHEQVGMLRARSA